MTSSDERAERPPIVRWRDALLGSDLPSTAKLVGLVMSTHAKSHGGGMFPGPALLQRETSLARRAVVSWRSVLKELGWLEVTAVGAQGKETYRVATPANGESCWAEVDEVKRRRWAGTRPVSQQHQCRSDTGDAAAPEPVSLQTATGVAAAPEVVRELATEVVQGPAAPAEAVPATAPAPKARKPRAPADPEVKAICDTFWASADPKPMIPWLGLVATVSAAMKAGHSPEAISWALPQCPTVSKAALEFALSKRGAGGRPRAARALPSEIQAARRAAGGVR